jgi:hypothetical protein
MLMNEPILNGTTITLELPMKAQRRILCIWINRLFTWKTSQSWYCNQCKDQWNCWKNMLLHLMINTDDWEINQLGLLRRDFWFGYLIISYNTQFIRESIFGTIFALSLHFGFGKFLWLE